MDESPPDSEERTSRNRQVLPEMTVVGIGASAGGLDALKRFFSHVPADTGMAFVVIVHLSPKHESHLADLLQPHTGIPVLQVTETVPLERNRIYVIPPGRNLNTIDTHLRLTELEASRSARAPIDHFFRTLAETHDNRAVGVILTGTGSDGTLGLKRIKEKGGLTVVQSPSESEYDGMPQSAIATGIVDFILPVSEMPAHILRFARTEPRLRVPADGEDVSDEDGRALQKIFAQVRARTGRDFTRYKRSTLMRRIQRRMQLHHIEELPRYLTLLREEPAEVRALADDFLITVTNFFRDPEVYTYLKEEIIPRLFGGKGPDDRVRVWSIGCATGEEAYSLAMLLVEHAEVFDDPPQIQVFASDLHELSLRKAREGYYAEDITVDISPERLKRFFKKEDGGYHIRQEIRELVIFAPHDLLSDPPFSKIDLISCRNLLIYLQREVQRDVIELFHYALEPDGFLVLGTSETVDRSEFFRTLDKKRCIFRRRDVPTAGTHLPVFPLIPPRQAAGQARRGRAVQESASYGALHQKMVEQYAPPSILVNPDHDVVHVSEHAGRYLQVPGGAPTSNVFKLVREELRIELRTALHAAQMKGEGVRSKPVAVDFGGGERRQVVLQVRPALEPERQDFLLVIFDEAGAPEPQAEPGDGVVSDATSRELEAELALTKERLQAVIEEYETQQEEMKAANEELQSANEELRSTMEELETSKEELQSLNEELQTVNQENRHKVEELSQLSGDLQNLMASTDIATLFLNRDLRILRFTPRVSELFNMRGADRGRPLSDLTHHLGYGGLIDDAREVLKRLIPVEREVQDEAGRWYLTRVLPYRSTEDRIEGVVITFVDITKRRRAEEVLRESEERYRTLFESIDEGFCIVEVLFDDGEAVDYRFLETNPAFEKQTDLHEAVGKRMRELEPQHEAHWFEIYGRVARTGEPARFMNVAKQLGDRIYNVYAFRVGRPEEHRVAILFNDITERIRVEEALRRMNETLEERVEERTRQVRELASRLTMAEQQERRRISQILHDDLQQLLYGIQMKISAVRQDAAAEGSPRERLLEEIGHVEQWLTGAIATTRQLTVDLSPPILKGEGLTDALRWLVQQMEQMHGLKIDLDAAHTFYIPDEDTRVLVFQVVRELLFNVIKHAETDRAALALRQEEGYLVARITDEGRGFDVAEALREQHGGFGLFSVRERLNLFGGFMEIESAPGAGTRVTIRIPTARTEDRKEQAAG